MAHISPYDNVTIQEVEEFYNDYLDTYSDTDDLDAADVYSDASGGPSSGGYESEDDLVFFLEDSEDEEEDEAYEEEGEVNKPKVIKPIPAETVEKMKILDGKLSWADDDFEHVVLTRTEEDKKEYPLVTDEQPKEKAVRYKFTVERSPRRLRFRVNFVEDGQTSGLCFGKENERVEKRERKDPKEIVCKFILEKQVCPYGPRCKFSHTIPTCNFMRYGRICPKGPSCKYTHPQTCPQYICEDRKCKYFHPRDEVRQRSRPGSNASSRKRELSPRKGGSPPEAKDRIQNTPIQNTKLRFCRNIIQEGKCKYQENCKFAHRADEVMAVVDVCRFKKQCKFVTHAITKNKKGDAVVIYKNNPGTTCCWRLHPREQVTNFIARTSMTSRWR